MNFKEYRFLFELEEDYWWYVGMRKIVEALLLPAALPPSAQILDVGCGTGYMLTWLGNRAGVKTVMGADISPVALEFCRRRELSHLARASVARLPFAAGSFDLLTCFEVLDWFSVEDVKGPVSELNRVLKPGGWLLIRLPAFEWLRSAHDEAIGTVHRYNASELGAALRAQGLKPARLTYAVSVLFPLAMAWRWLRRASRSNPQSDVRPLPRGMGWMNSPLAALLSLEAAWLRAPARRLPFGLSLFALARKGEA